LVVERWRGRIYGRLDAELSAEGEEQSRSNARALAGAPLAAVISSGSPRAEHTAALMRAGRDLPRRDDPRLAEIDRGDWAGFDRADLEAVQPGAWDAFWAGGGTMAVPGGESLADVVRRVREALDELADEFSGRAVAIVAHRWVIRAALCQALDLPVEHGARFEVQPAGGVLVDWPGPEARREGRAASVVLPAPGRPLGQL